MLFNSIDFAVFLPLVFLAYWFIPFKNIEQQNFLLLLCSYIFYGWWNWRFLSLIIISSGVDYIVGKELSKTNSMPIRKRLLIISILVNLGFLSIFKYYNFFAINFTEAFEFIGLNFNASTLNIILPVGISFYTFQTMSYTIDVYKKKLEPTNNIIAFFSFVSFFPQLVAGPIERATHLLPQFTKKRNFEYSFAVDGLRQMLWGFFKKIVIADNCAPIVNNIFNNSTEMHGSTLLLGAILFSFQIYGDFSGYSDIAIGLSRLFGFDLKRNFAFPYFSRDIAEFWRRWHISLSTWFRDYVYIPLGGSKHSKIKSIRNIFIIFIVSGFWHGANWTFIIWGTLNAIFFLPLLLRGINRKNIEIVSKEKLLPDIKDFYLILKTFALTTFAWIFFRANSVSHAIQYVRTIFSKSLFSQPLIDIKQTPIFIFILTLVLVEWIQKEKQHALQISSCNKSVRSILYVIISCSILLFSPISSSTFIYFQF